MSRLRASYLAAESSILAYHSGVYHLLGFYSSAYLVVGSYPCLLAYLFPFRTWV